MWFDWSVRLSTLLALVVLVSGLGVLALPERMEGQVMVQLDIAHSLRFADLVGAGLVAAGAGMAWLTVLAWQRRRLQG
jgi:hypothetical protein